MSHTFKDFLVGVSFTPRFNPRVKKSKRCRKPPLVTALLSNAQEMGLLHPDTFTAQPSLAQLDGLKEGDVVKICVLDPGERFWCIVNSIKGETITAEVNNMLVHLPWPLGMKIRFHRDCIYQLWDEAYGPKL